MSKTCLVSIILPILNGADDIKGVFTSLANQESIDKQDIEIIIVDDGSTDTTRQTINDNKKLLDDYLRVFLVTHPKRQGQAEARLNAARRAKGKYLVFTDKKVRPDSDYIAVLLSKKSELVIGNIYMDKSIGAWNRLFAMFRKKLYFPYFNNPFDDITLDYDAYKNFKNKGGGGAMLVLREHFIRIASSLPRGINVSDDSLLIEQLAGTTPLLKTSHAKALYINREGLKENTLHIFNRGPKFVDYYIKPGTRFFFIIPMALGLLIIGMTLAVLNPMLILYFVAFLMFVDVVVAIYLSESLHDFFVAVTLLPVAVIAFAAGIYKGIALKLLRKY